LSTSNVPISLSRTQQMYDTPFTLIEQYNSDYESIFSGFKLYLTIILIHNILYTL
jgi:hypothetical protein